MDDLISREMAIGVVGRRCGMCIQGILDIPAAQPEIEERKEESAQNVPKEDLISLKAAIDALIRKIRPHNNGDGTITMCVMSEELVRETLNDLPAAQSEKRTEERTETHACDLISRQAAITEFSCCELTPDGGIDANYAIDFLKQLPSTQSERKTGRWIPQDHNRRNGYVTTTVYYYPKCSECGHSGNYGMNYCPNCGAYMGGDEE